MSFLFSCGFEAADREYYVSQGWYIQSTSTIIGTTPHRSLAGEGGDYYLHSDDTIKSPSFSSTARWLHFWWSYKGSGSSSGPLTDIPIVIQRQGSDQFTVFIKASGFVQLLRGGSGGTVVATSALTLTRAPHWFAIELLAQNAAGVCNLYVDGAASAFVTYTGDTQALSVTGWDSFELGKTSKNTDIDDVIVTDNVTGRLDERYITSVWPDSDVAIGLTPTPGPTSYTGVDERPPSTAEYNTATAALQEDIYGTSNLSYTPASIDFVNVHAFAARDGAITLGELICRSGAVTSYSATKALTAGTYYPYSSISNIWDADPNTGVAWLTAGVNAMSCGIRFS